MLVSPALNFHPPAHIALVNDYISKHAVTSCECHTDCTLYQELNDGWLLLLGILFHLIILFPRGKISEYNAGLPVTSKTAWILLEIIKYKSWMVDNGIGYHSWEMPEVENEPKPCSPKLTIVALCWHPATAVHREGARLCLHARWTMIWQHQLWKSEHFLLGLRETMSASRGTHMAG